MSTADSIWWQRNVISYHKILDDIGAKHGTSPNIEDLNMFNQETYPDPLDELIAMGEQPIIYETKETEMAAQAAKKVEKVENEPQLTITPALKDMLEEMAQKSYTSMVRAGNWIGTLLSETTEMDYIASLEETMHGIVQAINGVENYAYNRELSETDPTRVAVSGGQWEFLSNMATQVIEMDKRLDTLESAGFIPHNSFEQEYNAIRSERIEKKRLKAEQASLRAARKKGALQHASDETKARLSKRFA